MAHGPRKIRVLSEIIKSRPKWDKMDEKWGKIIKFMNCMRIDYADYAQSTGIYGKECLDTFSMSHVYGKTRVLS